MSSKYLSSLSSEAYTNLKSKLDSIQHHRCYICCGKIDLDIHPTEIDHIIPLALKGKDNEDNFALTHDSCNRTKLDANLKIARILLKLKGIQDDTFREESKPASLKHVLSAFEGSKYDFRYKIENDEVKYSFPDIGDVNIYSSKIFEDPLSKEKTAFIAVPIQYIFHDELINPRGLNTSINKLIKEFEKGNPQLHLTLSRIDDNKLKIFDGQHKAVAQILLGVRKLLLRVYLNPDLDRLIETNTNAGSTLRQIAFDKSIMSQLNNTLYYERVKKYQSDHNLLPDDFSFSEQQLVDYFKGEGVNIRKYINDSLRHSITHTKDNKLKDFIDFEGRAKEMPISYSAYDKTFLSRFIDSKLVLNTNINYRSDEGLNPRELEISQLVHLLNIIAEELYIGKFDPEEGISRIEKKILERKDADITDDHLIAYRISKEEIMFNWLLYLQKVIEFYFDNTGKIYEKNKLFQKKFDEQLWMNIRNFMRNLRELPLWKDRSMASTIFSGKNTYPTWKAIFETGRSPDGAQILARPLNFQEMIRPSNR